VLVALEDAVYALDSSGDVLRLSEGAPARLRSGARQIAGKRDLLLVCAMDGTLEGFRKGELVLRERCMKNLSPEMMAVTGNSFVLVTAPRVLTVSRGGRTVELATEVVGEYEVAMSAAGAIALADYARGGRSWFVREGSDELEPGPTYAAPLFSVAAGGQLAAWGYRDGMVIALDTRTGAVWKLRGHPDAAFHMVVVDDMLVTASPHEVRVWDLRQPPVTQIGRMPCFGVAIRSSPDGGHAGLDCLGGTAWLWSRATGQLATLHKHEKNSDGIEWLGDRMCSSGWDGRVLCSTVDGATTRAFDTGDGRVLSLAASPDHRFLALASTGGRIWKLDDRLQELYSQGSVPSRVAISPAGTRIASGGLDGSLVVFDVAANRVMARILAHVGGVQRLGWLGDELWTSGGDSTLRRWGLRGDAIEPRAVVHESARLRLTKVFAAGWAASVGDGMLVIHRDGAEVPLRLELDKHIDAIDVSPDARYVAAAIPGEIVVVDVLNDRLATLSLDSGPGVMFVDAETLAVNNGSSLKAVRVNELAYLRFVPVPQGHDEPMVGPPQRAAGAL
jgi:WD40 repeat protein